MGIQFPKDGPSAQITGVITAAFIVFIVTCCLGLFTTSKCAKAQFSAPSVKGGLEAFYGLLSFAAVAIPVIYTIYCLKGPGQMRELSYDIIFYLNAIIFFLIIIAASLCIWLASLATFSSTSQHDGVTVTCIIFLVLAIVLPAFWLLFHNREMICNKIKSSIEAKRKTPLKTPRPSKTEQQFNAMLEES